MLDPEGFHIVYCCTNAHDGDYGIGVHWANEIELSLPVSRVNTAESEMTRDIANSGFSFFISVKFYKLGSLSSLKLKGRVHDYPVFFVVYYRLLDGYYWLTFI